jgi:membrane-bound lytic murein transglycosylase MltF
VFEAQECIMCCKIRDRLYGPTSDKVLPRRQLQENDRSLFAFASYNAGPGNISKMRKEAGKRGLDPDKWFKQRRDRGRSEDWHGDHHVCAQHLYKYYVAYKLQLEARETARKARDQVAPVTSK